MERAYTLGEIERLRSVVRLRQIEGWFRGNPETQAQRNLKSPRACWGGYRVPSDLDIMVEEHVRTYMTAGLTADDLLEEEREAWEAQVLQAEELERQWLQNYKEAKKREHQSTTQPRAVREFVATWTGRG